jgi:cardiolipin synthase A/B
VRAFKSVERWTNEKLYFDGDAYFADVLAAIESAKSSVHLETYIYDADALGERFEQSLTRAALRGVRVRLLVDGIGAARWIERRNPALEKSGVLLRVYHPVVLSKVVRQFFAKLGGRRSNHQPNLLSRLNRRDHRKICVVDESCAFVGSLNISSLHCASLVGSRAWRDTGLRVEGPAILDLLQLTRRTRAMSSLVCLNYTLKLRRKNSKEFKSRLKHSTQKIWLTNAYLSPSAPLVRHITQAAERGVEVRLLVPRKSDVFFMPWVATSNYAPLLKSGVRIFEYLPRFLHAKCVIIDGWSTIGTSNLNRRSAYFDFEVDLVVTDPDRRRELEEQFHRDLELSEEVSQTRSGWKAWLGVWLGWLFTFLFKRYL